MHVLAFPKKKISVAEENNLNKRVRNVDESMALVDDRVKNWAKGGVHAGLGQHVTAILSISESDHVDIWLIKK